MEDVKQLKINENFSQSFAENKINIRNVFQTLYAEKWLIIPVVGLMLVLGIVHAIFKTPLYQASILLQVESKPVAAELFGNDKMLSPLDNGVTSANIQIALIKSQISS